MSFWQSSCFALMITEFSLLVLTSASVANSNSRFGHRDEPFLGRVAHTRAHISDEVEKVLTSKYRSDNAERLSVLENEMSATYLALPKTAQGYLGAPASRYLIHRHFYRSRAWLVRGLAPDGGPWNASSPTALLNYSTPEVKELFEQRLRGRGLNLQEVALLTAMIENRVHQDAVDRLHKAWDALEMPGAVSLQDVEHILDAWMMSYIRQDASLLKKEVVNDGLKTLPLILKRWPIIQSLMHGILRRSAPHDRQHLSFDDAERAVVEISETYGKFSEADCKEIKMELMAIEGPRPGRVDVREFFREAINGKYHFAESVAYMNHTGILDYTDPDSPSIVIPNYVDAPSQNVFESDTFSLVCVNECEHFLHEIERQIQAPYATPERLASVVSTMSSDTQPERSEGPPPVLLRRLSQIAQLSRDRTVPLHGRLFAQWLHHAFPRECPYPHVSTAGVEFLAPDEYKAKYGNTSFVESLISKQAYADGMKTKMKMDSASHDLDDLPWDTTEEVLAPRSKASYKFADVILQYVKILVCISFFIMLLANATFVQELCTASKSARSKIFRSGPRNGAVVASKLC